jgi:hypothetical protein
VGIAIAALVAACLPEASGPPPSPTPTLEPEPTAVETRVELGATVWYAGWVVGLGTAEASLDAKGGRVTIDVTLQNDGEAERSFDDPIRLVSGTAAFEPARETVFPDVAVAQTGTTRIVYDIIGPFALATAKLVIGDPAGHQPIIPFGGEGLVGLEPVTTAKPPKPTAAVATIRMTMTGGEVRADLPDWGLEMPRDLLALSVTFDAAYLGSFGGGIPFTRDNVALQLPDGKVVGVRRDGRSLANVVLKPKATQTNLSARFEIPAPAGGTYRLVVRDSGGQASIAFWIPIPTP